MAMACWKGRQILARMDVLLGIEQSDESHATGSCFDALSSGTRAPGFRSGGPGRPQNGSAPQQRQPGQSREESAK
jgi:hypothetical protein